MWGKQSSEAKNMEKRSLTAANWTNLNPFRAWLTSSRDVVGEAVEDRHFLENMWRGGYCLFKIQARIQLLRCILVLGSWYLQWVRVFI